MIYLEPPGTDPYFNLALEEYVFEQMDRSRAYFMLWQNSNTIVVGKYQNTAEEINQAFVDAHGIRVVRRLSGGGAVYHDTGNLNFTFIVDQDTAPGLNFKIFVRPVVEALARFGVHAEFTGRNDLTIGGMKFSGNSQYAKHGRLLHHGCIMLDSNLTDVADALRVKQAKFDSKAVKSVRSRVTTINTHAPTPIAMEDFKSALRACAMAGGALEPYTLTAEDMLAVQKLRDGKYVTWAWNYGFSPPYDMRREARFPAGLVTAHLRVKQGCIQAVRFYGDFFGSGPLEELEAAMAGLPLDAQLAEALAPLHVEHYMSGITAEELARSSAGVRRGELPAVVSPPPRGTAAPPGRRTGPDTAHGTAPVPPPPPPAGWAAGPGGHRDRASNPPGRPAGYPGL